VVSTEKERAAVPGKSTRASGAAIAWKPAPCFEPFAYGKRVRTRQYEVMVDKHHLYDCF
jgi:hypothetical protein